MSFDADIILPEEILRDMLAATQTARVLRTAANRNKTWAELVALIDAGGTAAGDIADAIVYGGFDDDAASPVARPRWCLRQLEDDNWRRTTNTSWEVTFNVSVIGELTCDAAHITNDGQTTEYISNFAGAYLDGRRKFAALAAELARTIRTNGVADVQSITYLPVGEPDVDESESVNYIVGGFSLECRGQAGGP